MVPIYLQARCLYQRIWLYEITVVVPGWQPACYGKSWVLEWVVRRCILSSYLNRPICVCLRLLYLFNYRYNCLLNFSACLSICLVVDLPIYLPIYGPNSLLYLHLSMYLSSLLPIRIAILPSYQSNFYLSTPYPIYLSVYLPFFGLHSSTGSSLW